MNKRIPSSPPNRISVDALYKAHSGFVASFLSRMGVHPSDVSDLVQEVFLVAHRKGGFVQGPAKPRSWLGAIAFRIASSHRRKKSFKLDPPADTLVAAADPELSLQAKQALHRVEACLDSLDTAHRAVFVLFEIEAVSCGEIAETLEIPVGTVYRRLHEARALFRSTHEKLQGEMG